MPVIKIYILVVVLTFSFLLHAQDWIHRDLIVRYNSELKLYDIFFHQQKIKFFRPTDYENLLSFLVKKDSTLSDEWLESLQTHALFHMESTSPVESIIEGLQAFNHLGPLPNDCTSKHEKRTDQNHLLLLSSDPKNKTKIGKYQAEILLRQNGFMPLGKLLGKEGSLMTFNDNFLHGIAAQLGLQEKTDGNDLGLTYAQELSARYTFEKGEIYLGFKSQGYSRPNFRSYTFDEDGTKYRVTTALDEDGKLRVHFLDVEGVEFDVLRHVGTSDWYVRAKVLAEYSQDGSGLTKHLQNLWHKIAPKNIIEYRYYDFIRAEDHRWHPQLSLSLGTQIKFGRARRSQLKLELGHQEGHLKQLSGPTLFVEMKLRSHEVVRGKSRFPKYELILSQFNRHNPGQRESHSKVLVLGRWPTENLGVMTLSAGLSYLNGPRERAFSQIELKNRNRLDPIHLLGIGFSY